MSTAKKPLNANTRKTYIVLVVIGLAVCAAAIIYGITGLIH